MSNLIYLRPLTVTDANVSYLWRADPEVWKYTQIKANNNITQAIEADWLQHKLLKDNDARFAICLTKENEYIGNAQLIEIENGRAELYIFIGDRNHWASGVGSYATQLILQYGFNNLQLNGVFLHVNKDNTAAMSIFNKYGFSIVSETDSFLEMNLDKQDFSA